MQQAMHPLRLASLGVICDDGTPCFADIWTGSASRDADTAVSGHLDRFQDVHPSFRSELRVQHHLQLRQTSLV